MIRKTKDYDSFVFRQDNREKIDKCHVAKLIESIKSRNLLELRPIIVNDKMEIIDGQHRVLAAKALDVEIYYQVETRLDADDIIKMNISKSWTLGDYLNFYCQHEYEEYLKLREFMKKNNLILKVALTFALGQAHIGFHDFKMGKFKFHQETLGCDLDICWETINFIKKMNGFSSYTNSSRFWKAMLKLIRHPDFDKEKWIYNVKKLTDNFCAKARQEDYNHMMQHVYNWRNPQRINLLDKNV